MEGDGAVEDVIEEVLEPTSAKGILDPVYQLFGFVEANGWLILIGAIVLYIVYQKLRSKFASRSRSGVAAYSHVREEDALERMRRIEAARLRQQAQFDAAAAKFKEEQKLKEEKAAKEKIEDWERLQQGLSYKSKMTKKETDTVDPASLGLSGSKPTTSSKSKLKPDYNPLMGSGDGGSCSFKSGKRGGAKGG